MKVLLQLCLVLTVAVVSCGHSAWAGAESTGAAAKAAPKAIELSGKVMETQDGGGYTYVLLKTSSETVWVAIPLMKVKVGQELKLLPGYEFKNFNSKALNRRFDRLIFSGGVANQELKLSPSALKMAHKGVQEAPATKGAAPSAAAPAASASNATTPPPIKSNPLPVSVQRITKAKGPNAYTVAQLYTNRGKLEKKPVVVRGRVVKVTTRIMKRNWIHIKDGSGSEAKKNNDIVVTSKDLPKEGDLVTVKGTLYNRLDFGSGYRYELIIQDARIK